MATSGYARSQELLDQFKLEEDLKNVEMQFENPFKLDYTKRILKIDDKKYPRAVRFEDILSAELIIDEKTTSGKSTTSVLGRAALFGILTGGAGAIVGAMTAKSTVKRDIRMVAISLTVPAYDPINKPLTYKRSGPACLNRFTPRDKATACGLKRCRVVHGGGGRCATNRPTRWATRGAPGFSF